jgi:6-phosphogluconolactonase (cycloisomerase 2 family)
MNIRHCYAIVTTILCMMWCVPQLSAQDGTLTFVEYVKDDSNGVDGLDGVGNMTISPDGLYLYATASIDSAITVFSRNSSTGALTFVEKVRDDSNGVDGIATTRGIAISPDGKYTYVSGQFDNAVAIFGRNSSTGELTYIEHVKDDSAGVTDMAQPRGLVLSPDGVHLYVSSKTDYSVAIFSRNSSTGALSFVEYVKKDSNDVSGLAGASEMKFSPDGAYIYIGGPASSTISVFNRDFSTGALTFVEYLKEDSNGVSGIGYPSNSAVSPDGAFVYTASNADSTMAIYSRNNATGELSFIEYLKHDSAGVSSLAGPRTVLNSPDGANMYVVSGNDSSLSIFTRDGSTGLLTFIGRVKEDSAGVYGIGGGLAAQMSPDGKHVYICGSDDNTIAVFSRQQPQPDLTINSTQHNFGAVSVNDSITVASIRLENAGGSGQITSASSSDAAFSLAEVTPVNLNPGVGTTVNIVFKPTSSGPVSGTITLNTDDPGNATFVINVAGDGVVPGDGKLTFVEFHKDDSLGVAGLAGALALTISPDDRNVYVPGQTDNALAVFSRNAHTGALTYMETHVDGAGVDGLATANGATVSPDGRHVFVTGHGDDALAMFSRDSISGALTYVTMYQDGINGMDGLTDGLGVTVSPDGHNVYVVSQTDHGLSVFRREADTDSLIFLQMVKNSANGVTGINEPKYAIVSPDGENVYVTGYASNSIAVFNRNPESGILSFIEAQVDGSGANDGLSGAHGLSISPDGRHVLTSGSTDNAITVFSRNASDGSLTYLESHFDNTAGVDGIESAAGIDVSPDGAHVFVAGQADNAVAVFLRDIASGALTFLHLVKDDSNGVKGLATATRVSVSKDGRSVYATGFNDNALAVFQTFPPAEIKFPSLVYGGPRDTVRASILSDYIYTEDSVLSVDATILYPDSIMHFVGIDTLGGFQMSGFTFTDSVFMQNAGNQLDTLIIAGASSNPITGAGPLFELVFVVDSNSVDGDTAIIEFDDFELNEGFPLVVLTDGWFENAVDHLIGDVDSNGTIQSLDASLVLQENVRKFSPEDSNQIERMDVSGNGDIRAYDASLILQHVAGMITTFPAGSTFIDKPVVEVAPTTEIQLVAVLSDIVEWQLALQQAEGVTALDFVLEYDSEQFAYMGYSMPEEISEFMTAVENEPGRVALALASAQPMETDRRFISLRFRRLDSGATEQNIQVTSLYVNELLLMGDEILSVNGLPTTYAISQNYPNPFNPVTTIRYQIPEDVQVRITVHNLLGQVVATLVDEQLTAGYYSKMWSGQNKAGLRVASGVYLYRIQAGSFVKTKKMLLLK